MPEQTFYGTRIPVAGLQDADAADVRVAALELLVNRPYSAETWSAAEEPLLELLERRCETSNPAGVLELAARAPLPSVREGLRRIANDPSQADFLAAREALAQVGENRFANMLIEDLGSDAARDQIASTLAKSPLDRMRIKTQALESCMKELNLEDPADSSAYVWCSIALAKKGRFKYLNRALENLEGGWRPGMFRGNPFVVEDEIRTAAWESGRLVRYAENKLKHLRPEEKVRIDVDQVPGDPKLSVIRSLLAPQTREPGGSGTVELPAPDEAVALFANDRVRGILERNLASAMEFELYHDIAPNLLRDLTANLHEIGPDIEQAYLPALIGNDLVELTSRLPAFVPDGPGLIVGYRDFLRNTGNRSPDFETQLAWLLARGDLRRVLDDCDALLDSHDEFERQVAWSLTRKASRFREDQPPPIFGAGGAATSARPLWYGLPPDMMSIAGSRSRPGQRLGSGSGGEAAAAVALTREQGVAGATLPMRTATLGRSRIPLDGGPDMAAPSESAESAGSVPGQGSGRDDPPRTAYAHLDCPDEVEPMIEFTVSVGLAKDPTPGVTGRQLVRPEDSVGAYELTIALLSDGFLLRQGEANEITLRVTAERPYPRKDLHLRAVAGREFRSARTLMADYSIDGQFIGSAARSIRVVDGKHAGISADLRKGFDLAMPPGVALPDMTISITKGNTIGDDRLVWNVMTPHDDIDVSLPSRESEYKSDIGSAPELWARNLMNAVNENPDEKPLGPMMVGAGREVRKQMPLWVRRKLLELAKRIDPSSDQRPTLLIVSDEANIPWELAYLELGEQPGTEDFLGAAFTVGRWVHGYENVHGKRVPAYPPPTEVRIRSMAVVSGDYRARGWGKLEGAEQEASELSRLYEATTVKADKHLATWLSEQASVDAIHFAVHGKWGLGIGQDGIVLEDGTMLTAREVLGATLKGHPFVFLNACQLGQGEQTLGDYGGIAAAFLEAGAGGVVAALWNVDDRKAKELALDFYDQVGKAGPGEVFRHQRSTFQKDLKSKLSLAYQFFGHPQMRIVLDLPRASQ